jgi:hypothetical protein
MLSSALVLNAWAMNMLRRAYLDDFPATVCVLAAVLLLIEGRRSSMLQVSAAGGLCGMSFLMKDFSLIWGPIGLAVVVALGLGGQGQLPFKEVVSRLRAFGAGYATLVAPKMIWSWIELGGALENPVRYWLLAKYFGTRPIDSHYPFFLYHDPSYSSRVALSGGMVPAVMNFRRPLTGLLLTLGALSFVWLWLAPVLVSLVEKSKERRFGRGTPQSRLGVTLAIALLVYCAFFGLGLGEATQFRYWIAPVTLALVLGVDHIMVSYHATSVHKTPWAGRVLLTVFLLLVAGYSAVILAYGPLRMRQLPPHEEAIMAKMAEHLPADEAALLSSDGGIYYWSLYPADNVVAFPIRHLVTLDAEKANHLFETYNVRLALYYDDGQTADYLKGLGFVEIGREQGDVLLIRQDLNEQ